MFSSCFAQVLISCVWYLHSRDQSSWDQMEKSTRQLMRILQGLKIWKLGPFLTRYSSFFVSNILFSIFTVKLLDEVSKIILYNFLTFFSGENLLRLKRVLLHNSSLSCETHDYLVITILIPCKKPISIYKIKWLDEA